MVLVCVYIYIYSKEPELGSQPWEVSNCLGRLFFFMWMFFQITRLGTREIKKYLEASDFVEPID